MPPVMKPAFHKLVTGGREGGGGGGLGDGGSGESDGGGGLGEGDGGGGDGDGGLGGGGLLTPPSCPLYATPHSPPRRPTPSLHRTEAPGAAHTHPTLICTLTVWPSPHPHALHPPHAHPDLARPHTILARLAQPCPRPSPN